LTANHGDNHARIGNDKINKLFDQVSQELDEKKRFEIGNEIDKEIWDEGYSVPLYVRPNVVAVRDGIAYFGAHALEDPVNYAKIGFTK